MSPDSPGIAMSRLEIESDCPTQGFFDLEAFVSERVCMSTATISTLEADLARVFTPARVKAALRVLDSIDRSEERLQSVYSAQRQHQRTSFRGPVTVLVPVGGTPDAPEGVDRYEVYARNVSPSGMSFIYPGDLRSEHLIVGIHTGGGTKWFHSQVRRSKEVVEDFWEYGVSFSSRANVE